MDGRRFDDLVKGLESTAPRRRVLQGLGGLALGSAGLFGTGRVAFAQSENREDRRRRTCKRRCDDKCDDRPDPGDCRDRCRERCNNKFDNDD